MSENWHFEFAWGDLEQEEALYTPNNDFFIPNLVNFIIIII